ncbi:MAG TPA: hypothetical protein PLJ89_04915 [Thermoleophilia bacterium]|nr:hypothetical protein [Acidobacteriota bacterium]NLT92285.1 hypothetical protein [Actinomycetota bacterium]HOU28299.1 hypothetical protein [Thermoleophilia bacterium]HQF51663.1 hypothetical protein [Thermoleophilia bacterium]HQH21420.1 hypothetical protein [Thermoleophilia bacterium]
MRSGADLAVWIMAGAGVLFTLGSVATWAAGRRAGAVALAVVAGVDFAFAISLLTR